MAASDANGRDMAGRDVAPLIVTLRLDGHSFERLDALRRAYFPPERNFIPAHLTLFHALPGTQEEEVVANLATACAGTAPLPLRFSGLRGLGKGVAFNVDSPPLLRLRALLAGAWHDWLTPQDRNVPKPHVTVQNKVDPSEARNLLGHLQAGFEPWDGQGEGLLLWRYRGGPWEAAGEFPFRG
ncbi:2'-5' RNA ligase family protein [Roseomonas elaeocarpi]|uniref:2'-5' RNA ligase family protein n=1 Tax=Roseomonas elaeocarpi TaxID=907779 RepID=A0ABV6JT89_9PROT